MKSTPPIMNWISRAPSNSAASPDRSSLAVSNVKSAPVLRSASARAASSSSVRYTTALAPARASATIALRFSLSLKATTSGGRLNPMHPQDYRDSAREAAPNMFDWRDPLEKSEWPNGDREAAQGGHPRQEGVEGTAQETHAAGASAVHRCRPAARTRPGRGGGAPNRQRPHEQSQQGTRGVGAGAARTEQHRVATTLARPPRVMARSSSPGMPATTSRGPPLSRGRA